MFSLVYSQQSYLKLWASYVIDHNLIEQNMYVDGSNLLLSTNN